MANLSMGLCGKLARSLIWSTFALLDSDLFHWIKLSALWTIEAWNIDAVTLRYSRCRNYEMRLTNYMALIQSQQKAGNN